MRGRRTLLIALPFRAGLTLGGRLSRPARRSTDVPCRAPGHVPRTIQVGVQPISAALACEGSPRTSGGAAAAPAAVAGRERPRQGLHAHPLSSPLGAHHVLSTPERPGVESSIPCSTGLDFGPDPCLRGARQPAPLGSHAGRGMSQRAGESRQALSPGCPGPGGSLVARERGARPVPSRQVQLTGWSAPGSPPPRIPAPPGGPSRAVPPPEPGARRAGSFPRWSWGARRTPGAARAERAPSASGQT
jgi:hypothetical protein